MQIAIKPEIPEDLKNINPYFWIGIVVVCLVLVAFLIFVIISHEILWLVIPVIIFIVFCLMYNSIHSKSPEDNTGVNRPLDAEEVLELRD